MFYPADRDEYTKIVKGTREGKPHNSLEAYGSLIFRLCLNTILSGSFLAKLAKLSSAFVPNSDRLVEIRKQLSNTDASAEHRLQALAPTVLDLHEFARLPDDSINLGLLLTVSEMMWMAFLELKTVVPAEVEAYIQDLLGNCKAASAADNLKQMEKIARSLKNWKGPTPVYVQYSNEEYIIEKLKQDVSLVLWTFAEYASGPHFQLQAFREGA